MSEYRKLNTRPVAIVMVIDEHDENMDFEPSFWFNNSRHYLCDFMRVHNNPWIYDDFPDNIYAMEANEYYHPLFIELLDDECINIYEEKQGG